MANVRYGGGVADIAGSIGGTKFSRGKAGSVMQARRKGTNPRAAAQQTVRANLSRLTAAWNSDLTEVQRTAWKDYADGTPLPNKLGDLAPVTGLAMFLRTNALRLLAGKTILEAAPATPGVAPIVAATVEKAADFANLELATAPAPYDDTDVDDVLLIYQSPTVNPGKAATASRWRFCAAVPGVNPGGLTLPLDVASQFTLATGTRTDVKIVHLAPDGKVSAPYVISDIPLAS